MTIPEPINWYRLREITADIDGRRERYADAWMLAPRATLNMLPGRTSEQNTWVTPAPDLFGIRVMLDESMPPGSWRILSRDGVELERSGYPSRWTRDVACAGTMEYMRSDSDACICCDGNHVFTRRIRETDWHDAVYRALYRVPEDARVRIVVEREPR